MDAAGGHIFNQREWRPCGGDKKLCLAWWPCVVLSFGSLFPPINREENL